jgi:hypothetical protein
MDLSENENLRNFYLALLDFFLTAHGCSKEINFRYSVTKYYNNL